MELKFRAWHKESTQMQNIISMDNIGTNYMNVIPYNQRGVWPLDEIELMQFTGMKDSNDVDIYMGDILSYVVLDHLGNEAYPEEKGVVEFEQSWFAVDGWTLNNMRMKVIGNIYEHPHLLEEK